MQSAPDEPERSLAALVAPDILDLLETDPRSIAAETEELHPADLADVAELIDRALVPQLLAALPAERAAAVLEYLSEELRVELLETMPATQAAALIVEMDPDERADALEEMDEDVADNILEAIPERERAETERLLQYEADTAGGLMTTEFVSVPDSQTVDEALATIRALAREGRREAMQTIYVVDTQGTLTGVMSLHGVNRQITFPAVSSLENDVVTATAEFAINRKDFGVVYPGKPDDLIRDDVLLKLTVKAAKKA